MARLTSERDSQKKELETKSSEILEKNKTITQVKKIGRRYKTQYEELKAQHDKVGQQLWNQLRLKAPGNKQFSIDPKCNIDPLCVCVFKLVEETAAKAGSEAGSSQEVQQELTKAQEELNKAREELTTLKEEAQKKQEEVSRKIFIIPTYHHHNF